MVFISIYWYTYNNRRNAEEIVFIPAESSETDENADSVVERVNLNAAEAEDLIGLMFIDEEQAELIISYREKNGRFESIEETAQIEGILPVTYKTLEEFTYVD
ncbi:MAG: hypothetical protein EGQ35_05645 [Clostridiales bacterium]|nr:hypothetical protein [Clostridiales bacterium]